MNGEPSHTESAKNEQRVTKKDMEDAEAAACAAQDKYYCLRHIYMKQQREGKK